MSNPIRVVLVDDHDVVRSGLSAFLIVHDDLDLIGEARDGQEAVHLCQKLSPDVVLMDMMMPVMNGAEATQAIRSNNPNTQVIVLTSFKEDDLVHQALEAGAIGYLLKNVSADELANAIRAAHAGRPTLAPEATEALIHSTTRAARHQIGDDLTEREREVLALIIDGLNNSEIADRLIVSRSTIRFHVSNILSKLHVSSRTEAVTVALKNNLLD